MPKLAAAIAATCLFVLPNLPAIAGTPIFLAQEGKKDGYRTWELRDIDGDGPITAAAIANLDRHLINRLRLQTIAFRETEPTVPTLPAIPAIPTRP